MPILPLNFFTTKKILLFCLRNEESKGNRREIEFFRAERTKKYCFITQSSMYHLQFKRGSPEESQSFEKAILEANIQIIKKKYSGKEDRKLVLYSIINSSTYHNLTHQKLR